MTDEQRNRGTRPISIRIDSGLLALMDARVKRLRKSRGVDLDRSSFIRELLVRELVSTMKGEGE